MKKFSYIDTRKLAKNNEIVATFYLEAEENFLYDEVANGIAAESSVGTWTHLTTLKKSIFQRLAGRVFYIDRRRKIVKIAYPLALFEKGSLPQLLSTISGNIFSLKSVKSLKLKDVEFPDSYINSFLGPRFGLSGIRRIYNVYNRPLLGSIIKPKVGLSPDETARLAFTIFKNGVDLVKDDETLTSMSFCKFEKRARFVLRAVNKAEKESGKTKIFVFNITAPCDEMIKRAMLVKKLGGRAIMVDILSTGFSAVQYLRKKNPGLIIHGHRAGHSIITKRKDWGISMLVLAKFARLAGIDELHTGTVVGKMEGSRKEIIGINRFLGSNFGKLKKVMPVASGGLYPSLVPELIKVLGKELIINFGGGIHGHPDGSAAGARAAYQAMNASIRHISLYKYAKIHPELKRALSYWKK